MTIEIDREAMENAANLAFDLFDQQGWELGELSAEDIARQIVRRYLEMKEYFGDGQTA